MEKLLAIVTEDAVYGRALGDFMTGTQLLDYSVRTFYSASDYLMYRDENSVSVLLADLNSMNLIPAGHETCFLLSAVKEDDSRGIYMFQAFDLIVRELLFRLNDKRAGNVKNSRALNVFAVSSGRGGSGVSTLALSLAMAMKKEGSTLFVCLDPFYNVPCAGAREGGRLSELIVELKVKKSSWMDEAGRFIRHGRDFDYINGVYSYEDLYCFGREEMRLFFSGLSSDARYKNLVFDLGLLPPGIGVIAEKCEKIFLIGSENEGPVDMLTKQLMLSSGVSKDVISYVSLPFDKSLSGLSPDYAMLENSEMAGFGEKLVTERQKSMSEGSEPVTEVPGAPKNEIVIKESRGFGFVKGKLKKIAEKGYTEGFGG